MQNVVDFGARRASPGSSSVISSLAALAGERLAKIFRETLAQCDDILFSHAQKATHGTRQAQYFDDLRQLRLSQSMAVRAFERACRASFEGTRIDPPAPNRLADDPLQLVADEDLEYDLALFRIGKRCDEAAPRLRHQVARRLAQVFGQAETDAGPLSGAAVARSCRAGLGPIELSLETRLIVLKQLERRLSATMESLFEAANALLVEHGVLPHLRSTPAAPRPTQPLQPSRPAPDVAAPTTVDVRQLGEVLGQVTQWMAQQQRVSGAAAIAMPLPVEPEPAAAATPDPDAEAERERERRRQDIQERRAAELQRARELRMAAERSAETVVASVLTQAHVPDGIGHAVRGPLRRHLEAVHARRGETSTEWRSACKLVRDIAWALDPETASSEQAHWRAMVPDIVTSLRATLLSVGTDEQEVDRIVADFGQRYEQLLGKPTPSQTAPDAPAEAVAPDAARSTTASGSDFSAALRQVRQLVLGRWFELRDDQGLPQRAKLVWTSAMTERCLFVNNQGKLVADRPHARVANDILGGRFREIDQNEPALA